LGGTSIRREAIAYLNVLVARTDRSGGRIEIYNNRTTLGRDPKLTDIQLFNLDDQSSVSGLHCTIFFDQGKFFITDDNSSNGTFLNGKRLTPNDPTELPNNSEIILGDLYRQGAKLTFEIATGTGAPLADAYPVEEPDFHFDIPEDGGAPYSPPPRRAAEDDSRKTIPGYRDDMDSFPPDPPQKPGPSDTANRTDIFHEPPASPPPVISPQAVPPPAQPKPAQPKKKADEDWMKKLG
jgi:predicted component of type VI protein secretion system